MRLSSSTFSTAPCLKNLSVFSGMLIATILGVLIVPGLYIMIENIGKKKEEVIATEIYMDSKTTNHEE